MLQLAPMHVNFVKFKENKNDHYILLEEFILAFNLIFPFKIFGKLQNSATYLHG